MFLARALASLTTSLAITMNDLQGLHLCLWSLEVISHLPFAIRSPLAVDFLNCLSSPVFDSIHAGCYTWKLQKWVVMSVA